ncbi:MAG: transposase [Acidimicrobiales bacterium]|nr:transposase [Acidimicrobiales bacterium]MDW3218626.1 transposase [Acidimicrobiales bacterium]MDW3221100.1 transposase [Acidimicrobiales bacterium]
MGTHRYPEEFRREAVQLYRRSDRPRVEIARSLGIADGSLAAWVNEFEARDAGGLDEDERAELIRLRKRVVEVEEEKEILRKAAQYFARETNR